MENEKCKQEAGGNLSGMAIRNEPTGIEREHYECTIRKVENGFILQFGCKTFIAQNWEEASTGISDYWKDPRAAQKKYTK